MSRLRITPFDHILLYLHIINTYNFFFHPLLYNLRTHQLAYFFIITSHSTPM